MGHAFNQNWHGHWNLEKNDWKFWKQNENAWAKTIASVVWMQVKQRLVAESVFYQCELYKMSKNSFSRWCAAVLAHPV